MSLDGIIDEVQSGAVDVYAGAIYCEMRFIDACELAEGLKKFAPACEQTVNTDVDWCI